MRRSKVVVVVFRSRLREENREEFDALAPRIQELAVSMPGFISYKTFQAADGERVSIIEFESEEHLVGWRRQVDHAAAQKRGREAFYSEFSLQICTPERVTKFRYDA